MSDTPRTSLFAPNSAFRGCYGISLGLNKTEGLLGKFEGLANIGVLWSGVALLNLIPCLFSYTIGGRNEEIKSY